MPFACIGSWAPLRVFLYLHVTLYHVAQLRGARWPAGRRDKGRCPCGLMIGLRALTYVSCQTRAGLVTTSVRFMRSKKYIRILKNNGQFPLYDDTKAKGILPEPFAKHSRGLTGDYICGRPFSRFCVY